MNTMTKNCETCKIEYKYCNCFLECRIFKCNLIEYKCLCCNKVYEKMFDEKLRKQI